MTRKRNLAAAVAGLAIVACVVSGITLYRIVREQILLSQLDSEDREERELAARTLGEMRSRRAIPRLVEILADPEHTDPLDRPYGTEALVEIGPAAIPALLDVLTHSDRALRGLADDALVAITMGERGVHAVPYYTEKLRDRTQPGYVRRYAATMLGIIGRDAAAAVPTLGAVFSDADENKEVRWKAGSALGRIGPGASEAVPLLAAALNGECKTMHAIAAEALKEIDGASDL